MSHLTLSIYGISFFIAIAIIHYFINKPLSLGILIGGGVFGIGTFILGGIRFLKTFSFYNVLLQQDHNLEEYLITKEKPRISKKIEKLNFQRTFFIFIFVVSTILLSLIVVVEGDKTIIGTLIGIVYSVAVLQTYDLFYQFRNQEYLRQLNKIA